MTDIVERLEAGTGGGKHWMDLHTEAANEIKQLRAEVERLQNELAHWMNHWRTKL